MIVYPYLGQSRKAVRGVKVAGITSVGMLIYCVGFALLSMGSHQIVLNSYGIVELHYTSVKFAT